MILTDAMPSQSVGGAEIDAPGVRPSPRLAPPLQGGETKRGAVPSPGGNDRRKDSQRRRPVCRGGELAKTAEILPLFPVFSRWPKQE